MEHACVRCDGWCFDLPARVTKPSQTHAIHHCQCCGPNSVPTGSGCGHLERVCGGGGRFDAGARENVQRDSLTAMPPPARVRF
eukprot:3556830-Alexandrium_andersonii.AAC.1